MAAQNDVQTTIKLLSQLNVKDILWVGSGKSPIEDKDWEAENGFNAETSPLASDNNKVVIKGDLIAIGRNIVSILEEVVTDQNTIILRDGATEELVAGQECGFIVKKYGSQVLEDKTVNLEGLLVFDNTGTAMVGSQYWDEDGKQYIKDIQPLAVRDFSNTDNQKIALWNEGTKALKASLLKQDGTNIVLGALPAPNIQGKIYEGSVADINGYTTKGYVDSTIANYFNLENGCVPIIDNENSKLVSSSILYDSTNNLLYGSATISITNPPDKSGILITKEYVDDVVAQLADDVEETVKDAILDSDEYLMELTNEIMKQIPRWEPDPEGY